MMLQKGDRIKVSHSVGQEDRSWQGRLGTFVEYTKPHGYARVTLDGDEHISNVLLHPESLLICCGNCCDDSCLNPDHRCQMPHIHTQACYGIEHGQLTCGL